MQFLHVPLIASSQFIDAHVSNVSVRIRLLSGETLLLEKKLHWSQVGTRTQVLADSMDVAAGTLTITPPRVIHSTHSYSIGLTPKLSLSAERLCLQIAGLSEQVVAAPTEALHLLCKGGDSRATGSTKMNETSSRSHAIFTLHIQQQSKTEAYVYICFNAYICSRVI